MGICAEEIGTLPIRLHLGCGRHIFPQAEGWINVDLPGNWSGKKPDVEADLRKLPFQDKYADEIHAIHVIEHFYLWEVADILAEWKRVLKPGGILVLELPDLEKVLTFFVKGEGTLAKTWYALYGDPNYKDPSMTHKWGYNFELLARVLHERGFVGINKQEAVFHYPARDMRVAAKKPNFKAKEIMRDSDQVYVFFTGHKDNAKELERYEWEKTAEEMGVSAILIADSTMGWYLRFADEITDYLRQKTAGKKVTCVGSSMGGYAALKFADAIGADSIAIVPQSDLKAETRWENRIKEVLKENPEGADISYITGKQHHIFYSTQDPLDKYHAERMTGVSLHPMPYHNHNLAHWMKKNGLLKKALRKEF